MVKNLNFISLVNNLLFSSHICRYDNSQTESVINLDISLSYRDKRKGFDIKRISIYSEPISTHLFPNDPYASLSGSGLEGISVNSLIILKGPLYFHERESEGMREYTLTEDSLPFYCKRDPSIFIYSDYYPELIGSRTTHLKSRKTAITFLDYVYLLDEKSANDDFQKELLEDQMKLSIDELKKKYFF
ncbi:MAG: hypothetical protein WC867_03535 [Candidatus Pacearchaeota archaeon]|jgi:hypothetical protein